MKLLKDLILTRKEFHSASKVVEWGSDGTLYFVTQPNITIGQPVFKKDMGATSKDLFHIDDLPLEIDNKFEYVAAERNSLLNSQPMSYIREIKVNQVFPEKFAALTNNFNVIIYKNYTPLCNIDQPEASLAQRAYHSFDWSPNGEKLAVGNEAGEVVIYKLENGELIHDKTVLLDPEFSNIWVIDIKWTDQGILSALTNNTVFLTVLDNTSPKLLLASNRFKITDFLILDNYVFITSVGFAYKIDINSGRCDTKDMKSFDKFHIIPINDKSEIILLSNSKSVKLGIDSFDEDESDDIIKPHLDKKIKRWKESYDPYSKYSNQLIIYDIALTNDRSSIAIVYNINKMALRYKITSQSFFNIMFVPLNKSWDLTNKTAGLAWYQIYNIYEKSLPVGYNEIIEEPELDLSLPFDQYLIHAMNNFEITKTKFQNMVTESESSIELFLKLIFNYANKNKDKIINVLDKASVQSLSMLLKETSPFTPVIDVFTLQSDYITETFDINNELNNDLEIVSQNGNKWRRCAITLLPILTTKVKVCPVSGKRIIDIKRDTLNDFGWFTRTLLETFNEVSIFSGGKLNDK